MSDEIEGEDLGEQTPRPIAVPGEGADVPEIIPPPPQGIKDKKLTFEEASKCLSMLGKDESGARYAYLMMAATNRKLTDVSIILKFKHILFLDLSGNFLELNDLQVLTELPYLVLLKAQRNKITSAALTRMPYLQVLVLGDNSILDTADIDQPILETLDLSNNEIFKVEFDHLHLNKLKILDLHGNHLEDISGTFPTATEKLFLAGNNIRRFNAKDMVQLRNLQWLHLRNNKIRKLNGFTDELENLTYLNLRGNNIKKFRQFRKLECLNKLDTLIVLENPVAGEIFPPVKGEGGDDEDDDEKVEGEDFGEEDEIIIDKCVIPLLVLLPNLTRINKHVVTLEERDIADKVKEKKMLEIMSEESSDDDMATTTDFTDETGYAKTVFEESEEGEESEEDEGEDDEEEDFTEDEKISVSPIQDDIID